jgi:small subunit ribosomal protein S10
MYIFQIKAYEPRLLNKFIPSLKVALTDSLKGDISISVLRTPMRKKRFTLLKSPHVNKTAREQFEVRAYSCLVKVNSTSIVVQDVEQTIQKMVPPGITIKCTNKYVL